MRTFCLKHFGQHHPNQLIYVAFKNCSSHLIYFFFFSQVGGLPYFMERVITFLMIPYTVSLNLFLILYINYEQMLEPISCSTLWVNIILQYYANFRCKRQWRGSMAPARQCYRSLPHHPLENCAGYNISKKNLLRCLHLLYKNGCRTLRHHGTWRRYFVRQTIDKKLHITACAL